MTLEDRYLQGYLSSRKWMTLEDIYVKGQEVVHLVENTSYTAHRDPGLSSWSPPGGERFTSGEAMSQVCLSQFLPDF